MASGLPTVCADATGSNALVQDGITGLLAPSGDARAFLDAVACLVTDGQRRREMGHKALARAQDYEWDTVMARITSYYDEVLAEKTSVSGDGAALSSEAPSAPAFASS